MPIPALIIPLEPGKYYHVFNRGNNKEKIFYAERDYDIFLRKYALYLDSYVTTYAFCLLANHFHFLIRIKEGLPDQEINISNQFRKLFISHSRRTNMLRMRTGCLLTRNFRRIEITDEAYLRNLIRYIHFNPVKHGYTEKILRYPHSSFIHIVTNNNILVARNDVLDWFGGIELFLEQHLGLDQDKEIRSLITDE
jgi:REP element-mobilizing transposase RayT